jgi:hypothetical protein
MEGKFGEAREALAAGHAISAQIAAQHPEWPQGQKDLAWIETRIDALARCSLLPDTALAAIGRMVGCLP